jgi:serine/threonine-protein phosphatase 2A regulatory subunit A
MALPEEGESVYPIAILIDELKNEDVQLRLNSIRRLPVISKALGTERTRLELIPYLNDSIDDEDEVLLAMAEELGKFVPYVGGPHHATCLLVPLESLCNVEEAVVREKAVASLNAIAKELPRELLQSEYVAMVRRLAKQEWATSRSACSHLLSTPYPDLPDPLKAEFRDTYTKLSKDEEPMVRRSACSNLKTFVAVVTDRSIIIGLFVPLFIEQSKDEQDSVRLLSVENCIALAKALGSKDLVLQYILPGVRNYCIDKSWRVRYMLADHFTGICESMSEEVTQTEMVQSFIRLATDPESEVRTSIACKVYDFCVLIKIEQVIKDVLPIIRDLVSDQSQHVRAALARVIMKLSAMIGKDHTINFLLPCFCLC